MTGLERKEIDMSTLGGIQVGSKYGALLEAKRNQLGLNQLELIYRSAGTNSMFEMLPELLGLNGFEGDPCRLFRELGEFIRTCRGQHLGRA